MPILHVQYDAEGQPPDGKKLQIPPRVVLLQNGPCVQVVIGLAQSLAEQLVQQSIVALIGRDYLQHCTLFYNGLTGEITLAI